MAETAEETIRRLQTEVSTEQQRVDVEAARNAETPESTITRLQQEMAASQPAETAPRGIASLRDPAYFNRSLANIIGLVGSPAIAPFLPSAPEGEQLTPYQRLDERISASRDATVGLFERLGFVPPDLPQRPDTLLGAAMSELPGALAFGGATVAGAPRIAAAAAGATSPLGRSVGQLAGEIAARPVTAASSIVGAEPGMVMTREAARPYIEAATPGADTSLPQAVARSAALFATEMLGSIPTERLARAIVPRILPGARSEIPTPTAPYNEPILRSVADPEVAGRLIRARQVNLIDQTDRMIVRTLEGAGVPGITEANASRKLRGGLLAARDFVEAESRRAYSEVPEHITGQPGSFRDAVSDQLNEASRYPAIADTYDVPRLRSIQQQLQTMLPDGTPVWRTNVPIKELSDIRSRLIQSARDASETSVLGSQASRERQANLNYLVDELTRSIESIGSADPKFQPAFDYANKTYRMFNDRFRRGPIGEILMNTRAQPLAREGTPEIPGGSRIPPTMVARELLNPNETAEAVAQAVERMGDLKGATILNQLIQQRVVKTTEDAVRVMFQQKIQSHFDALDAAATKPRHIEDIPTQYSTQPGPVRSTVLKARQWVEENGPLLERWTNLTSGLMGAVRRMTRLQEARQEFTTNIATQFMGRNAPEVVDEAIRSPNPGARFRSIFNQFHRDDRIIEGIQRAVIDSIFEGRGGDPNVALSRMRQGNYREALEAIFRNDPKKLQRLYEMTDDAAKIVGEAVNSSRSGVATLSPADVFGNLSKPQQYAQTIKENVYRIGGLMGGHVLLKAIPLMGQAASLSVPMRMGRAGREMVVAAMLKDRKQALNIVRDAVMDPNFEAWLNDKSGTSFAEQQAHFEKLLRYLRRTEAATNQDVDEYLVGNADRMYWQERRKVRASIAEHNTNPFGGQK